MTESDESHQDPEPIPPAADTPTEPLTAPPATPTWPPGPQPWRDPGAGPEGAGWPAPPGGGWGGHPGWAPPPPPPDPNAPGGTAPPPPGGPWAGAGGWPGTWAGGGPGAGAPGAGGGPGGGWPGGGWPGGGWAQHPAGPGGWSGWAPARPRRSLPGTVTALLLAVAVLVGLGIGHGVWSNHAASAGIPAGGNGSGGSNSGGSGSPFGGLGGTGNGSSGSSSLTGPEATVANELVDIDVALSYQQDEAEGTGIVLSSKGLILTNNHVISGATSVSVVDIGNGKTYDATVLGYDRAQDVAVLQLQNASGLKAASLGDSSSVSLGQSVVGIGNAGGVGGTPSTAPGQITALDQSITAQDDSTDTSEQLSGLIETNCNIEPGDSGGALIASSGKVVGMDTAASVGFSFQTQGSQGYAIGINQAMQIARQIEAGHASSSVHVGNTAFLGVEVRAANGVNGALIAGVIPNGAAAAAGLVENDVITNFGGSPVSSPDDLTKLISADHPGQTVQLTWQDPSGNSHTGTITLASGPPQ